MIIDLLPHPRHADALKMMREREAELRPLLSPDARIRPLWWLPDDEVEKWLLAACHQYSREHAVYDDYTFQCHIANVLAHLSRYGKHAEVVQPAHQQRAPSWERDIS